jgi:fluoroquinolone transport system ATP-binding protein
MLSMESDEDKDRLNYLIKEKDIETIHSQEATLEEIFIKVTGRGLN